MRIQEVVTRQESRSGLKCSQLEGVCQEIEKGYNNNNPKPTIIFGVLQIGIFMDFSPKANIYGASLVAPISLKIIQVILTGFPP